MKKRWLLVISVLVLICALAAAAWASQPIKIVVNGQELKTDVEPQVIGNRTMAPVRWIAEALGAEVEWDAQTNTVYISSKTLPSDNQAEDPVLYKNTQYSFSFSLNESWKGYSVIADKWESLVIDAKDYALVESGPQLFIRHPLWKAENPRQDIPIMVFTHTQWNSLGQGDFHIGAAPMDPKELGRNSKYVFALPARYNYAFPVGYEEVEKILAGNPLQSLETNIIQPETAKEIIAETAARVVKALSTRDAAAIADFTHPVKGLRFTPYTYVAPENDLIFSQEDIKNMFNDPKVYKWGYYDGIGEDINLTPSQYYEKFVYDQDYVNAEHIGYNEVLSMGNMLENQFQVYENAIVAEYYFSGFNPDYSGMDWSSLRLVFQSYENDWKLVGIINNQWTI
ncbi:MAG: copper amine oxidase N-terminal domain-containing protein [Syntrophomonas sp.]|nr:copper amine oxidase N-terminal domain-containing protein [Syntrophomonas sp.]